MSTDFLSYECQKRQESDTVSSYGVQPECLLFISDFPLFYFKKGILNDQGPVQNYEIHSSIIHWF